MTGFKVVPEIERYDTVAQYLETEPLSERDLLVTNEYIYEPFLSDMGLNCAVCFQEKYGAGEPTDRMIEAMVRDLELDRYDRVIGLGGGTILDICKILAQKGARDLEGLFRGEGLERIRRLVLIPTTCGTGSEVTGTTVINLTERGTKLGLVGSSIYSDKAVLIPELLNTLPYRVFTTSSIDALVHGIESYLNPKNNRLITMMAEGSIAAILETYLRMKAGGTETWKENAGLLLEASCAAGIAFSNNSCAAVHALSYALGGKYHVPHGESNYQFLTAVLRAYKAKKADGAMASLEALLGRLLGVPAAESIDSLDQLLAVVLENKPMRAYGAVEEDVEAFADSTVASQQRLLSGSFVSLTRDEIRDIYAQRL